jgi:hypothetical protein
MKGLEMRPQTPTFLVCPEISLPPTVSERKRLGKGVAFCRAVAKVRRGNRLPARIPFQALDHEGLGTYPVHTGYFLTRAQ